VIESTLFFYGGWHKIKLFRLNMKINMSGALAENIFMSVDDDRKHASI